MAINSDWRKQLMFDHPQVAGRISDSASRTFRFNCRSSHARSNRLFDLAARTVLLLFIFATSVARAADSPIPIGSRLELMVDDYLIESLEDHARRVLHHPVLQEIAIDFDAPWEGSGSNYPTVFRDGDLYRMYYRGAQFTIADGALHEDHPAVTCYAESRNGIDWEKPKLGLFEFAGSKENNIVWMGYGSHNFVPFKDSRPDVPDDQRYKALAYADGGQHGLAAIASPDGLHWRLLLEKPVLTDGDFDSQNVAFWDKTRDEYRAYYRKFHNGVRDIRTATSKDFLNWSEGQLLEYPGAPREELYTNQIKPYYRAPHILIGLPTRYIDRGWSESMQSLPEVDHRRLRSAVQDRYGTALTDTVLMTSRDGQTFHRWNKTFLPPGPERTGAWNYGHLYTAWGMVETAAKAEGMPNELSIYATESAWTEKAAQLRRYTLRIDGFASVSAPDSGGEMRTKAVTFKGKELVLNMATSIAGSVQVEIQDFDGNPIEGFGLDGCSPIFGNSIERIVKWNGNSDVSSLADRPVRLRFVLKDADLYSLKFR
jgi:hypothetical protein